jgi:hypothetical protein
MIIAVAVGVALLFEGNDPVCLARNYRVGDVDVYRLQVSPVGSTTPLGNAFEISIHVTKGPVIRATGAINPYKKAATLAEWQPTASSVRKVIACDKDLSFLPYVFSANDTSLRPGEMEGIPSGSIKLVSVKDSVAQLKSWMSVGEGLVLMEDSDVEVGTRRPNHAQGVLYRQLKGKLVPVRAFVLERIRSRLITPIPQEDGH